MRPPLQMGTDVTGQPAPLAIGKGSVELPLQHKAPEDAHAALMSALHQRLVHLAASPSDTRRSHWLHQDLPSETDGRPIGGEMLNAFPPADETTFESLA